MQKTNLFYCIYYTSEVSELRIRFRYAEFSFDKLCTITDTFILINEIQFQRNTLYNFIEYLFRRFADFYTLDVAYVALCIPQFNS